MIDVGAGTGILSEMAMDCGAKCVHAIERSQIADIARQKFEARKDKNRMALYKTIAEDFSLGQEKA